MDFKTDYTEDLKQLIQTMYTPTEIYSILYI